MEHLAICTDMKVYSYDELTADDRALIEAAKAATATSYVPYSHFSVGAAARLKDGTVVSGSNQENAAYPSGLCAERTTLFYANAQYPNMPVETLAVAARTEKDFIADPIPPCGACRQVMLEVENRYGQSMRVLLYGRDRIYEIEKAANLLPLSFNSASMED
ncbi:MAG: cytidine deaminase [Prevotellaceae bacterium]|nr:cytidine deaminase [Prevotellaceae bacterium]